MLSQSYIAHHGHDTADTEGAHDDVPLVLLHPDGIHFQWDIRRNNKSDSAMSFY